MKNIVITGFMASGKTTVSRILSEMTGMGLVDTDELIEKKENKSVNEIFCKNGEAYFRKKENEVSNELSEKDGIIISTGGGFVLNRENINNLRKNGIIFLLDVDFSIIEKRIQDASGTRPLMQNSSTEDIRKRFLSRRPFYDNCDYKIKAEHEISPEEFAKKILDIYERE